MKKEKLSYCFFHSYFVIFAVYVFFGSRADLIQFSTMLQMRKLLDAGEYVIIYIDFEAYSEAESYIYFWSK